MRYVTFATAGLLGLAAATALAQAPAVYPGTAIEAGRNAGLRDSEPHSNRASNILPGDTRSNIAPTLPMPPVAADATPADYLRSARDSLLQGRTGQAQQALEMAETRALARSVAPEDTFKASNDKLVLQIADALHALGAGDQARAMTVIDLALTP